MLHLANCPDLGSVLQSLPNGSPSKKKQPASLPSWVEGWLGVEGRLAWGCHACEKIIRGTFRFLSMYVYMYTYVKDIRRSTGQNLQLERDAARERERRRGREEQEDDLDSNGE